MKFEDLKPKMRLRVTARPDLTGSIVSVDGEGFSFRYDEDGTAAWFRDFVAQGFEPDPAFMCAPYEVKAPDVMVGVGNGPGISVTSFQVKDSGKREEYGSGMVRDTQEGKPDYTLIDPVFLKRWAVHMTKGAVKYGRNNWRKADSAAELERFRGSAVRHMMQWLAGETDEDHASAVAFNLAAAEYVKGRLSE